VRCYRAGAHALRPAGASWCWSPADVQRPLSRRHIQSLRQRAEHQCHPVCWCFQSIQRRGQSGAKSSLTGETSPPLDPFRFSSAAITHDGMDLRSADAVVRASTVRTSHPLGVHLFWCSPAALDLSPGAHRSIRWFLSRCGVRSQTTRRASERGAWLEAMENVSAV
jgi:hypothetical protein